MYTTVPVVVTPITGAEADPSAWSPLSNTSIANVSRALKKDGHFLYITCSVFGKENEEVVEFIESNLHLQLQSMQYLKGYDKKADTLFVALFSAL